MSSHHTRFKDCPWYMEQYPRVTIGGIGGIGSWLSFFLGRIGVKLELHDFDFVDYTNMGGQLFRQDQIGKMKTQAAMENIRAFSPGTWIGLKEGIYPGTKVNPISFSCFDSMNARRDLANEWFMQHGKMKKLSVPTIFIDGRMTVESFQIFAVTPERFHEYMEKYMFDDSRVEDPICSMKATSHIGAAIGSAMTQLFTNYMTNHLTGLDIREIPLHKQYEASFLDFI